MIERLTYKSSVAPMCYIDHMKGNVKEPHELNAQEICVALNKLAEYEDLDEQGLLLRLPCKVGDTVWRIIISDNYIIPCNVEEFVYSNSLYIIVREELFNTRRGLNIDEIGNSVFLTQAEAEQKLKEMEND